MPPNDPALNLDGPTVAGFGQEWSRFDQTGLTSTELEELFEQYFGIFPWEALPTDAVGFDAGCGSGRWARFVAPRVGRLHCIDASRTALQVAQKNLNDLPNCEIHLASVADMPLPRASMDFGYALGVLHHMPDTLKGLTACADKLRPGAPLLVYLYYAFDNRPNWYRLLHQTSERLRTRTSNFSPRIKGLVADLIAACVYFPLARFSRLLEAAGLQVSNSPLAYYRRRSFYVMRNDALDRFGTPLEQRFTAREIEDMMCRAGLERIRFSSEPPFWCAVGYKQSAGSAKDHTNDQGALA